MQLARQICHHGLQPFAGIVPEVLNLLRKNGHDLALILMWLSGESLYDPNGMAEVKVKLNMESGRKIPFQTHPNVDKKQFKQNVIALKSGRPFPVGTEVGVVKWRFQSTDEEDIPLTVN